MTTERDRNFFWKGREDDELTFDLTKLHILDGIWKYIVRKKTLDSRIVWTVEEARENEGWIFSVTVG